MKSLWSIAILAALAAVPAAAQSSRTVTFDREYYDGTRTVTRDGQGNLSRDTQIQRARDGAVATRQYDRSLTGNGWTASGSQTGFTGRTRSFTASGSRGTFPAAPRFRRR